MEIKDVREPNEEEKSNIIPKIALIGITTAIVTAVIYLIDFHFGEIGESLYLAGKISSNKTALQHDMVIKVFEVLYGRDYMLSKLEGLPVSMVIALISEIAVVIVYKVSKTVKGLK